MIFVLPLVGVSLRSVWRITKDFGDLLYSSKAIHPYTHLINGVVRT